MLTGKGVLVLAASLKSTMLKQRIITAMILIPLTLLVLFYLPPAAFCFLTAFIALGAAWEWSSLMEMLRIGWRASYLLLTALLFVSALYLPVFYIFVCASVWWLLAALLVFFYPRGSAWWAKSRVWRGLMGLLVLVPCWAAINYIRNQSDGSDGIYALLFLFVLIWGADSAAYFAGKKWGRHKLAPNVSPGKSIEGLAGALVFTVVLVFAVLLLLHIPMISWLWCFLLSLVTVLFSIVGDLFESMLKRQAGLKDSGRLLPGHGGLLDRIDSLTAAAPIFVFGSLLLGMYGA